MNAMSAPYFVIGLIVGVLAGWFMILVLLCAADLGKKKRGIRTDEPYTDAYDSETEWVLDKDQQYKRVKKP